MCQVNNLSSHDIIELTYGPVTPILSKALRSQIVAGKGNILYGGDFANIEGRLNAWFSEESWKLAAFEAYDRSMGPDLYCVAYSRSFGVDVERVEQNQRQIGKTQELACGYQGSIGAWLRFDPNPTTVTRVIKERFLNTDAWLKAADQYDRARHHLGLEPDQWIAIKIVINSWREANPRITQSWWDLQDAAIEAVDAQGGVVDVLGGKVRYLCSEGFLWCRLPSGKLLAYAKPHLVERREDYLIDADGEVFPAEEFLPEEINEKISQGAKIEEGRTRTQVAFEGKNQKTGVWGRQYLYGGLQVNNVVQGTARELLRFAMHNVEPRYPIILHIHDELISEVDEAFGSVAEYENLMRILPAWLTNLPLAAKAWSAKRYIK